MLNRVTLNMTSQDLENVTALAELPGIRSKTHAVSTALAFTGFVVQALQNGAQLLLKDEQGNLERLVMPELVVSKREPVPVRVGRHADADEKNIMEHV